MLYSPRKTQIKRRRKQCPYCGQRFTIKRPLFAIDGEKEAVRILQQLKLSTRNTHEYPDQYDPAEKKLRRELEKAQKDYSDFSHEYPSGHGHRQSPNAQGEKPGAEIDTWEGTAEFTPDLFNILVGLNYPFDEHRRLIKLRYDCGTFEVYTTGNTVLHLDVSRGDYVAQAEAILSWMGGLCGLKSFKIREGGMAEATINVPCDSPLAKRISDTLPEGTSLSIMQPIGTLKVYRKGEECKEHRIEAHQLHTLLRGLREFLEEKLPNVTFKDRFFMFFSDVDQKLLEQVSQQVAQGTQDLQTLQVQTTEIDTQVRDTKNILGSLSGVQETLSSNLVQLTRYMDVLDGRTEEISQGVTDLLIARSRPEILEGRKLFELTQLLTYIHTEGECTTKQVCEHFTWSGGKVHRLLKELMHLGELERRRVPKPGRGRPYYIYQKKED